MLRIPIIQGRALVHCVIGQSAPQVLKTGNTTSPTSQLPIVFLIDTGANYSCIDSEIASQLSLRQIGMMDCRTASSGRSLLQAQIYLAQLTIGMAPRAFVAPAMSILAHDFSQHSFHGLLGWDILRLLHMTYDGPNQLATLTAGAAAKPRFPVQ